MGRRVSAVLAAGVVQLASAAVQNSTWYRVTPLNYSGSVLNMNTGDVPGDCYFGIAQLAVPFYCPDNNDLTYCKNVPILNIPGYNVYEGHIVEHDTRLGAYSACNPDPQTGVYACRSSAGNPGIPRCWYDSPQWAEDFKEFCDPSQCVCDAVMHRSVGMERTPASFGAVVTPLDGTPKCFTFAVVNGSTIAAPHTEYPNTTDAECCDKLDAVAKAKPFEALAFAAYNTDTRICKVMTGYGNMSTPAAGTPHDSLFVAYRGGLNGSAHYYQRMGYEIANQLDGAWYSTRAEGQCEAGQAVGDGCWWRDHGVTRRVNATCLARSLVLAVYAEHPACWDTRCAHGVASERVAGVLQPAFNVTSKCSVDCLMETALGLNGTQKVRPALDSKNMCKGFYDAFASADPAHFGCPDV